MPSRTSREPSAPGERELLPLKNRLETAGRMIDESRGEVHDFAVAVDTGLERDEFAGTKVAQAGGRSKRTANLRFSHVDLPSHACKDLGE